MFEAGAPSAGRTEPYLGSFPSATSGLAVGGYKILGTRRVSVLLIDLFDLRSLVLVLSHSFR
jgi:hypothetical protein